MSTHVMTFCKCKQLCASIKKVCGHHLRTAKSLSKGINCMLATDIDEAPELLITRKNSMWVMLPRKVPRFSARQKAGRVWPHKFKLND